MSRLPAEPAAPASAAPTTASASASRLAMRVAAGLALLGLVIWYADPTCAVAAVARGRSMDVRARRGGGDSSELHGGRALGHHRSRTRTAGAVWPARAHVCARDHDQHCAARRHAVGRSVAQRAAVPSGQSVRRFRVVGVPRPLQRPVDAVRTFAAVGLWADRVEGCNGWRTEPVAAGVDAVCRRAGGGRRTAADSVALRPPRAFAAALDRRPGDALGALGACCAASSSGPAVVGLARVRRAVFVDLHAYGSAAFASA